MGPPQPVQPLAPNSKKKKKEKKNFFFYISILNQWFGKSNFNGCLQQLLNSSPKKKKNYILILDQNKNKPRISRFQGFEILGWIHTHATYSVSRPPPPPPPPSSPPPPPPSPLPP